MQAKNKNKRRYGDYIVKNKGVEYAAVHLRDEDGKLKKKHILLSKIGGTQTAAARWAMTELVKHRQEILERQLSGIYNGVLMKEISFAEFKEKVLSIEKVYEKRQF